MAIEKAEDVAAYIDHTLLKPDATVDQIDKICDEAIQHGFFSVCVNGCWVEHCARRLSGTEVRVCSVVGFPLGAMDSRSKAFETRTAVADGADEIDMVINVGALKSGDLDKVEADIRSVVDAVGPATLVKVIIETALLSEQEKVKATELVQEAGADFVKTSTGFNGGGATAEDVALLRRVVGPEMGVKAAGGIRTFADALRMIESGATRLGASSGVAIVTGGTSADQY